MRVHSALLCATTAILVSAVACTSNQPRTSPNVANGMFRFEEHVDGVSDPLYGTVTIVHDSIDIDAPGHGCLRVEQTPARTASFRCGEFTIVGDKHDGAWRFGYRTTRQVVTQQTVCDAYQKQNGVTVCVSQHNVAQVRDQPVTGLLHLFQSDSSRLNSQLGPTPR